MGRRPPVLAPLALGYWSPLQNWIEAERGSVFLRTGTVSEAPYLRIVTPKNVSQLNHPDKLSLN